MYKTLLTSILQKALQPLKSLLPLVRHQTKASFLYLYLSLIYSKKDYNHYIKLLEFFDKPDFTYEEYNQCYIKFTEYILENAEDIPEFVEDPKRLLQLLYESNIIASKTESNDQYYMNFSYREKSSSNVNPQVPIGDNISYRFHYGLYKKNRMGRY